jgi:hypothetical protein
MKALVLQKPGQASIQTVPEPVLTDGNLLSFLPSTTVAQTSWPRIRGNEISGFSPRNEFKSLPQKQRTTSERREAR